MLSWRFQAVCGEARPGLVMPRQMHFKSSQSRLREQESSDVELFALTVQDKHEIAGRLPPGEAGMVRRCRDRAGGAGPPWNR